MKNSSSFKIALASATALVMSTTISESFAATQGLLGATSTGSVVINVTKTEQAEISGLTDLTLANWSLNNAAPVLNENVCVYSTRPGGGYTINATGSGAANAFTLASGNNTLPYSVSWFSGGLAAPASGTATTLTAGTTSAHLANASTTSANCGGGATAAVSVGITTAAMTAAVDGTYTGTLTLLVTPN